ncbi:MAG: hypothetical protein AAFN93_27930, partial [Bacteroidota bacterium]
ADLPGAQGDRVEKDWQEYRRSQQKRRFKALSKTEQSSLRQEFISYINSDPTMTRAKDKFRLDGGWESRFIKYEFEVKFLERLLTEPHETSLEAFSAWWETKEIKNLMADAPQI